MLRKYQFFLVQMLWLEYVILKNYQQLIVPVLICLRMKTRSRRVSNKELKQTPTFLVKDSVNKGISETVFQTLLIKRSAGFNIYLGTFFKETNPLFNEYFANSFRELCAYIINKSPL